MFAIIDIETTGGRQSDRITEIAIYIHDGKKITDEFVSLINPETPIPYFIQRLTGISNEMVADAPRFFEVAKQIVELTENKIFVAHNAAFDYNFLKNEFSSLGYDFRRKYLCSVKLARKLVPGLRSYSLGNLCEEIGIPIHGRHRASGDALATVKLLEYLLSINDTDKDLFASTKINSLHNLHPALDKAKIEELPEETGVYFFYNEKKDLIYVGKSKNIYSRVISHFNNIRTRKSQNMRDEVADIGYETTGSELVALLLESHQIKQNRPIFNRSQKRSNYNWGIFDQADKNGYIRLSIEKINGKARPLTSFHNQQFARESMERMVEKFELCQKLSGLYDSAGACFHYSIMQCKGACAGKESPEDYNARVEQAINRFAYDHENFIVIDKGRHHAERSAIKIQNSMYIGFGYFDTQAYIADPQVIDNCIKTYQDNRDTSQIIRNYLLKKKVEKIVVLDTEHLEQNLEV